jgi:hypothetical protein
MPWSALSVVRDPATSATDHCPASGRPDCTSTSYRWVRERPPRDFSTVTTPSDGDVRGTPDDDTTGSGHLFLPGPASDDHSDVVTAVVSTHYRHLSLRRQLAPLCPVHRCLHLFRASLRHGQRVWVRRTTTCVLSPSRSLQRSPSTLRFQLPRPLMLRLQAPGRLQLHLLQLRVPPIRLGLFSARTTTTPASPFDLRGPSLPRRRILPLCLSLRLLFCACCQRGRQTGGVEIGGVRGECRFLSSL